MWTGLKWKLLVLVFCRRSVSRIHENVCMSMCLYGITAIAVCIVDFVMHVIMFAAPLWFICIFDDDFDRIEYFYGLFYLRIDLGVGEGSEQHTLDFVPEAEARDSANTLFTVIRFQMILSAALLFIMVFALIKEKPLNTGPYDRLWKLFALNWFLAGFLGFITQFLGFGVGDSVNDCQSFVAPYFSMAAALINFRVMKSIQDKFEEEENPYEFKQDTTTSQENPIGRLHGIQLTGLQNSPPQTQFGQQQNTAPLGFMQQQQGIPPGMQNSLSPVGGVLNQQTIFPPGMTISQNSGMMSHTQGYPGPGPVTYGAQSHGQQFSEGESSSLAYPPTRIENPSTNVDEPPPSYFV